MRIDEIQPLPNELKRVEAVAKLEPGAVYIFKFNEPVSQSAAEIWRRAFENLGVHIAFVDPSLEAIYKLDRSA